MSGEKSQIEDSQDRNSTQSTDYSSGEEGSNEDIEKLYNEKLSDDCKDDIISFAIPNIPVSFSHKSPFRIYDLEDIFKLLDEYGDVQDPLTREYYSLYELTYQKERMAKIEKILDAFPQLEAKKSQSTGYTALLKSIVVDDINSFKALKNIDINTIFNNKHSLLQVAISFKARSITEHLLSFKDININYTANATLEPALVLAIRIKDYDLLKMLLAHEKINPNQKLRVNSINTPLKLACVAKDAKAVKLLLAHPLIDVDIKNHRGHTAMFSAHSIELFIEIFNKSKQNSLEYERRYRNFRHLIYMVNSPYNKPNEIMTPDEKYRTITHIYGKYLSHIFDEIAFVGIDKKQPKYYALNKHLKSVQVNKVASEFEKYFCNAIISVVKEDSKLSIDDGVLKIINHHRHPNFFQELFNSDTSSKKELDKILSK